jgi:hypothetical protein
LDVPIGRIGTVMISHSRAEGNQRGAREGAAPEIKADEHGGSS